MKNKGTVAYTAVKLLRIIERNEKIIKPAHEALSAEWEKWDKESKDEMDRISADINVDALNKTFDKLVVDLSKDASKTSYKTVHHSFLWLKWTQEVGTRQAIPLLKGAELHEAILNVLADEHKGVGEIICKEEYPHTRPSFIASLYPFNKPSAFLTMDWVIGSIHSGILFGKSAEFRLELEGSIISPNKRRGVYRNAVIALGKLRTLAELPDSELITLSDELAQGLDRAISITKTLEKEEECP